MVSKRKDKPANLALVIVGGVVALSLAVGLAKFIESAKN